VIRIKGDNFFLKEMLAPFPLQSYLELLK